MFATIGKFVYRRRWLVLVAGLLFVIASGVYGTSVFSSLKNGGFYDQGAESTKVADQIHQQLGRDEQSLIVLFTSRDRLTVESPAYKQAVQYTLSKLQGRPEVENVSTFYDTGSSSLVSNDHKSTYAVVQLTGGDEAQNKNMESLRPLLTSDVLQVRLGGAPAISQEISDQVSKDLEKAETATFPVLAILLIFIFGSLVAAALPLAIGGMVILGAFLILKVAANFTDVSIFAIQVITMLGLGLAIDYSLFVVSRFREELARQNGDVAGALSKTMQTAGRTVLFSGLTVAITLFSLQVFPQMFLKSIGLGGAAAVLMAMLSAVTVLPALLAVLGPRVNSLSVWSLIRRGRPAQSANTNGSTDSGFWYRTSRFVMRYPVAVLVATLVPLILVGIPFLRVNLSIPDARSLPEGRESRVVSELMASDFPKNETQPIQVLVHTGKPALDPASLATLYDYTRQLATLPGVTHVESLVNLDPRLTKDAYADFYSQASLAQNPQAATAAQGFSHADYSLVSVVYSADPLSTESQQLVRNIRALTPPAGMTAEVGGTSARLVDFLNSLARSMPLALGIIVPVIFVLLFLMLGSLVIPIKAVILNVLSLSVSFGSLVWIFQDGHLANLLGFTPLGSVDGTQPVLIFAIAFGLSMDYEVFLLSRIKEHYNRTKDTTAAVAMGVQKTGTIITSAALLLVVVIGAFATGEVVIIKEVGIGLALAVLVDATLVRMLLVPATMRILGKYNWWAPAPLTALYNRIGLSEMEDEESPAQAERSTEHPPTRNAEEAVA